MRKRNFIRRLVRVDPYWARVLEVCLIRALPIYLLIAHHDHELEGYWLGRERAPWPDPRRLVSSKRSFHKGVTKLRPPLAGAD